MAFLHVNQFIGSQGTSDTSVVPQHPPFFRSRAQDPDLGNTTSHFVYVQGVSGGVAGSLVTINALTGVTTLATTRSRGICGVLHTTIPVGSWGWATIEGTARILVSGAVTAGQAIYATGTPGTVSSTVVAGDELFGGYFVSASGVPSAGFARVSITNPSLQDTDNA